MRAKLFAGICTGLFSSFALVAVLSVTLVAAAPADDAAIVPPDRISLCHLEKKVDTSLRFNDGHVITPSRVACAAHCRHGDHPMPVPLGNNSHPNRSCARIHVAQGLPNCEVNTPNNTTCSVDRCVARCAAT